MKQSDNERFTHLFLFSQYSLTIFQSFFRYKQILPNMIEQILKLLHHSLKIKPFQLKLITKKQYRYRFDLFQRTYQSQIDNLSNYKSDNIQQMLLLQSSYPNLESTKWSQDPILFAKIHSFFVSKDIATQILPSPSHQTKLLIQLHTKTPQIKKLQSIWIITPQDHLEIKISLHDTWNQSSPDINPTLLAEIIKTFNRDTHGVYFFDKNKMHVLEFRIRLPFSTSRLFLLAHLREVYLEISHKFAVFAAAVKILPEDEGQPSKRVVESVANLRMLKESFEFSRQQRKKATKCYNLANNSLKIVSEAFQIIGICFGKIKGYSRENKIDLPKSNNFFKSLKKKIEQRHTKQQSLNKKVIAKGIQILHIHQQQSIDQGGFSKIYKGLYQITELLTCNIGSINPCNRPKPTLEQETPKQTLEKPQSTSQIQPDQSKRILIKKSPKEEADISYENQCNLLKYLRNQKSQRIAEYYLTVDQNSKNHSIFMEYYHSSFAKAHRGWHQLDLLKISRQILEGIHFLWSNKIVHRDLKQLNILIDSKRNAKIIDFGSASGFHSNNAGLFVSHHNRLMSTKSYFYPYNDLSIPFIKKQYNRQEFNQAETFDIFSFGQILINIFSLDKIKDNMVFRELTFLVQKCQEINPEDRIYPVEALCYLEEIIKLFYHENQIEKKGVEKDALKVAQQKKSTNSTSQQ